MADYKEMYYSLFRAQTEAIALLQKARSGDLAELLNSLNAALKLLKQAQEATEEVYISGTDANLVLINPNKAHLEKP